MKAFGHRPVPYDGFPLRPHQNGHWFKSVWNPRSKKSEQFYFGSWRDDPKGQRALNNPQTGWLARRDAIKAGIDNVRVELFVGEVSLGDLMARFLVHKRQKVKDGELSLTTLGDYLREVAAFVEFQKPATPAGGLRPEHFTAYMRHLTDDRKLGRLARKRVRAYVSAFLRFGVKNGWMPMPSTGVDWATPATDSESMRQAKARAGIPDYSSRIVTGDEIDRLLNRANPTFKAVTLLAVNCGLGPADIGRLRWNMIDLGRRHMIFPRMKTGVMRVGFLWKKTRDALLRLQTLKHNKLAIARDGDKALVFVTRTGKPFYTEREIHGKVCIDGVPTPRLIRIAVSNAISITFSRMAHELKLNGVTAYRLRHTFKTLGKRAKDKEALDLLMGHRDATSGKVYDHEEISWSRIKRVAKVVHRRLWPKLKPKADTPRQTGTMRIVSDTETSEQAA